MNIDYNTGLPISGGNTSSGVMEDVILGLAGTMYISVEGGKRYVLTPSEVTNAVERLIVNTVEDSPLESEIVFTTESAMLFLEISFPETLGWIGEPSFEAGKSYIINIRNNVAVCAEYSPGVE